LDLQNAQCIVDVFERSGRRTFCTVFELSFVAKSPKGGQLLGAARSFSEPKTSNAPGSPVFRVASRRSERS
jgi:hypothetical protein